jgi:hypothetical protein
MAIAKESLFDELRPLEESNKAFAFKIVEKIKKIKIGVKPVTPENDNRNIEMPAKKIIGIK